MHEDVAIRDFLQHLRARKCVPEDRVVFYAESLCQPLPTLSFWTVADKPVLTIRVLSTKFSKCPQAQFKTLPMKVPTQAQNPETSLVAERNSRENRQIFACQRYCRAQ